MKIDPLISSGIFFLCCFPLLAQGFFDDVAIRRQRTTQQTSELVQRQLEAIQTFSLDPSLVVRGKNGEPYPLTIEECSMEVRLNHCIAETQITLRFYNPSEFDEKEGRFLFPLPDGATVDGYALDIDGELIDGVAVEKQRAKTVFETIQRSRIDPGLVEWLGKNSFQCRVYPIGTGDERTIRLKYVEPITGPAFRIPLRLSEPIEDFSLKITSDTTIKIEKSVNGLDFIGFDKEFAASADEDVLPQGDIVLDVSALWNHHTPQVGKTEKGETFFVFRQPLEELRKKWESKILQDKTPKRVAVYWDASGSRSQADSLRDIELLRKYFAGKKIPVDLVVFRNKVEPVQSFPTADERFFEVLDTIACDGGTNFAAITFTETAADIALLFSDGNSTFEPVGVKPCIVPPIPVFTFLQEIGSNDARLRFLARSSGGECFAYGEEHPNLDNPGLKLLRIEAVDSGANDLCWMNTDENTLFIAGRLTGPTAKLRLHFGHGKTVLETREQMIEAPGGQNELPGRVWAQLHLSKLLEQPQYDSQAILNHGKKYRIVTPETSLLVLEGLRQYQQFEIEPPANQPELVAKYHEYLERSLKRKEEQQTKDAENEERNRTLREKKIAEMGERLQREWNLIVRWWEHPFRMPQTPLQFHLAPKDRREAFGLPRDRKEPAVYYGIGGYGGSYGGMGGFGGMMWGGYSARMYGGGGGSSKPASETTVIYLQPDSELAPSLEELAKVVPRTGEGIYSKYLQLRVQYALSPRFYVHCADYFANLGEKDLAVRILSNLGELGLDQTEVRRTCGLYFLYWNLPDLAIAVFDEISDTHLQAVAQARLAEQTRNRDDLQKSLDLYGKCLNLSQMYGYTLETRMDQHLIRLVEANRLIAKARQWKMGDLSIPFDAKLVKPLDADIRIIAYATHCDGDFDFAITEPSGEIVRRDKPLSLLGGAITGSQSCFDYMIRRAGQGKYKIALEYFGYYREEHEDDDLYLEEEDEDVDFPLERATNPSMKPGFVYVEVYAHYGRENERRRTFMVELKPKTEIYDLGTMNP